MRILSECCERHLDQFYQGRQSIRRFSVVKLTEDKDGYPDGWYLLHGNLVICPLTRCIFCHKELK